MKHLLWLLGLVVSMECGAQSTTFNPATGEVEIPCTVAADSRQVVGVYATYRVRLRRQGVSQQFSLEQLEPIPYGDDCTGNFDMATNLYTDIVNIGDNSYDIKLRRGAGNVFTLESATLRGPATTSLWVARNGANTVYLAGTIHVLRYEDYPLPRAYDEAYAKASTLYFEIDMDDPAESGAGLTAAQVQALLRDPQGKTLVQVLTPATYGLLRDYTLRWGIPIENLNPWSAQMLVNTFSYIELEQRYGFAADGVDDYLAGKAKADRKAIFGFETSALQYSVLHGMDEGIEDALVLDFLDAVASGEDGIAIDNMVRQWRSGDTTDIDRTNVTPMREHDFADYQLLQLNRNNAWLPQIEALLRTPETEMVVVGVAHMAGQDGLITQLRRRGYRVEKY